MKKKTLIKMLTMVMSLTVCLAGASCFLNGGTSTSTGGSSSSSNEPKHTHSLTKVEAKAATCTEDGYNEYYTCDGCKKLFTDVTAMTETSLEEVCIAASHTCIEVNAKAATCTEDGYIAHYTCSECEKVFTDVAGTIETSLDAIKVAASHAYVAEDGKEATYFEEGVKAHYTCENCEEKFLWQDEEYITATDADLISAKKRIADETTASSIDINSSDLINTVEADVKQFDQVTPTYVTLENADGESVQAVYFSRTESWDSALDFVNNLGFTEFRIPVNANVGGISFTYKLLDSNNDICTTLDETDNAYGMKSYIEYKLDGEYLNISKDTLGNICFMADGEWHDFSLECNKKNVEYIIFKMYHFVGEFVVTDMQLLDAKHIHETTEVPEKAETCTENGNTTYYTCDCGKFYADAEATQEIAENSWVLPMHHELSDTLEYNETHHYYPCTKCDYQEETAHEMGEWVAICIGEKTRSCDCDYQETAEQTAEEIDFTKNLYGASVYSFVNQAEYADRITETTADSLKYLLYHDNNVTKAAHKVLLPRIDFTKYGQVVVKVLFDGFLWDQQFGLTETELTNTSDTWVEAASYEGKLTFTWKDDALQMKLVICGKTLTQTITDTDIINGKASAYFCAQAYYDRYITLSGFKFIAPEDVNPYGDQYMAGYATISGEQYDENKRLVGLTVEIPGDLDWWVNSPVLTQDYLNALVAEKLACVTISVVSTTTTNSFITMYNGVPNYNANEGSTITLVENGGDLQFSYVDLNNDGKTVATTLTLTISYSLDPQTIADEIGLTLASGVTIAKETEGVYTLSNTNGLDAPASFSAEQVNAWIAQGYSAIVMKVSFTAGDTIDQIVGYTTSVGFFTNESGAAVWTVTLKSDEAISLWAQKGGNKASGAFTLSDIKLALSPESIAKEAGLTLASGVNITKDAEGVYTLSNTKGLDAPASFSAEQVNAWIAEGYTSISVTIAFINGEEMDLVVAYTPTTGFLTNGDSLVAWTFELRANEAIAFWAQKGDAHSNGAFTISQVTLNKNV